MIESNKLVYRLSGRYALFSDPLTRSGGEKSTLSVPTYQALKGITESIYWKPTITWVVDRVRIAKPIRSETKSIRPIKFGGGNDLAYYRYLSDVEYHVEAHFEFNPHRPDLKKDWNEAKHNAMALRSLQKGGRRDVFLGARECQGYVEPMVFEDGKGPYDTTSAVEFGFQYHSISYPDETKDEGFYVNFWNVVMEFGLINFCRPEDCQVRRKIKQGTAKTFLPDINLSFDEGVL
ncbi:MAG: type I-C CRISPR-associated protein Cas5c [Anaerolineaceae bacterium]|nr:type I-C CRISPR-associated protein Cas5c [Anaerolineaceae bacterium]